MTALPPNDQAIHDSILSTLPSLELQPPIRAIYFLIRDGRIVYVGQTTNLVQRLYAHAAENTKRYDSHRYWHLPTGNLNVIERELVWRLNPEYNGKRVRGTEPKRTNSINRNILSQNVSMAELRG